MGFHEVTCDAGLTQDITDNSSLLLINWETNHGCPADFTIWSRAKAFRVISALIEYTTVKCLNNFRDLRTTVQHLFTNIEYQSSCSKMYEYPVLTSFCHTMYFHSSVPSAKQWRIHVHKSLMINITIEEAYVPYNTNCSLHNIEVYDGHIANESQLMDYFCGKISQESVYTKSNKALLAIKSNTSMLVYQVFITARYTTHIKGSAYKFFNSCLPVHMTATVPPKSAFFFQMRLYYIWYLCNEVLYRNTMEYYPYSTIAAADFDSYSSAMVSWTVQVHTFECEQNSTEVQVYPGLLPFRWFVWMVKPYYSVPCNTTQEHSVKVDFHMYVTVRVAVIPTVKIFLNMTFQDTVKYASSNNETNVTTYNQHGGTFLHTDLLYDIESVTFKRITYNGQITTLHPDLVSTWSGDNIAEGYWSRHDIGILTFHSIVIQ